MREGGGLPFACLRDDDNDNDDAPSHPAARCFAVDSDSEQEERSVREVRVIFFIFFNLAWAIDPGPETATRRRR